VLQQINKRTHVRPETVLTDAAAIEEFADEVVGALDGVFTLSTRSARRLSRRSPVNVEKGVETAARAMGLQIQVFNASNGRERSSPSYS
jgi:hypothetical protein